MRVCELLSFLACHMLPLIAPVTCRPFHEPLYSDHSIVLRGGEEGEREKGEEREKIKRHRERERERERERGGGRIINYFLIFDCIVSTSVWLFSRSVTIIERNPSNLSNNERSCEDNSVHMHFNSSVLKE